MRVLALDPGDRVGWASADIADDGTWENLQHGILDLKECALEVHYSVTGHIPLDWGVKGNIPEDIDLVVCERWALYAHKAKEMIGSEIPSVQFIGMVKLSCWLANVPLVMQPASKHVFAERSMRKLRPELYEYVMQPIAHDDGHDLVAIKHLWAYTFDNYDVRPLS